MGLGRMSYGLEGKLSENFLPYGRMGSGRMGARFGMMGGSYGMMGYGPAKGPVGGEPLTLDEVQEAVEWYLAGLEDENLTLGEIMIFDNHAYAQIIEKDTGIGAMEVLVDPRTLAVSPEHGPNMMWNLKYSPMSNVNGFGKMGMMAGGSQMYSRQGWMMDGLPNAAVNSEMTIKPAEAISLAQEYLSTNFPNTTADDHADAFYGYYTIHTLEKGEVVGMLSVNGFTGQVFPHTWHGELVEMGGEADH
jgi:hypothetical protein